MFSASPQKKAPTPTPAPTPPKELTEEEKKANEVTAIRNKGNEHYKKKEWDEALAAYDQVLLEDPTQISVLNNRIVSCQIYIHFPPFIIIFFLWQRNTTN